jgi:hypothetical protein
MNKNLKRKLGYGIAALGLAGFAIGAVWASDTQCIPFTAKVVTGSGCPGGYLGYATMTNSTGGIWIVPPTNTVSGTFTNNSAFTCTVYVIQKNNSMVWCDTNSITFLATNSTSYQMTAYVKSPAPTNGQMITVQVNWQ